MDVRINDILKMKKPHPCGGSEWLVTRTGTDFRIRCLSCGRSLMISRVNAERNICGITREGVPVPLRLPHEAMPDPGTKN